MKNLKHNVIFAASLSFLILLSSFLIPPSAEAHCPLCVAGAAAGVTLTRWVGIDDSITGVWIAALLGAMSFWFYSWLLSKKIERVEKYKLIVKPFVYLLTFSLTIWSFYKFQLIIRMTQIFGFDKLTFGMLTGGILFYLVDATDNALIRRVGKVYFPYQRVVFSLGAMVVLSLIVYILINFFI